MNRSIALIIVLGLTGFGVGSALASDCSICNKPVQLEGTEMAACGSGHEKTRKPEDGYNPKESSV